jgi:hypothetical protein
LRKLAKIEVSSEALATVQQELEIEDVEVARRLLQENNGDLVLTLRSYIR